MRTATCEFLLLTISCAVWAFLFHAITLAVLSFMAASGAVCLFLRGAARWIGLTLIAFILVLTPLLFGRVVFEIDRQIEDLSMKPRMPSTLGDFRLRDRLGIWGLNVAMGLVGIPIYPEASRETLAMIFPPPRDKVRSFSIRPSAAMRSEKILAEIKSWEAELARARPDEADLHSGRLSWPNGTYGRPGSPEARAALAWNGCTMAGHAIRNGTSWRVDVQIREEVSYPWSSRVALSKSPELAVEEGLFRVLEEIGWLHPYRAAWKFTVFFMSPPGSPRENGRRKRSPFAATTPGCSSRTRSSQRAWKAEPR